MGSRVIKVSLSDPITNYPFNSAWPPRSEFDTLASIVQHEYYQALWGMDFDTFVLIAYSTVGGSAGTGNGYFTKGISEEQAAEETRQFADAAGFFLRSFPDKTFVFENWEGDWLSRAGSYDAKTPATDLSLESMTVWLRARQAGVTKARAASRSDSSKGNVYFSAEVNLIEDSRTTGFPNMINRVIPNVATDMISYSSYDTQSSPENFRAAMEYMVQQHVRTEASPPGNRVVFIAEYGNAQMQTPDDVTEATTRNVVNSALAFGASYVLFWETYCNECQDDGPGCKDKRCHDAANPVDDPARLAGFWLVRPDGTTSWPREYLAGKIQQAAALTV